MCESICAANVWTGCNVALKNETFPDFLGLLTDFLSSLKDQSASPQRHQHFILR